MEQAGLDITCANGEIDLIEQRLNQGVLVGARLPDETLLDIDSQPPAPGNAVTVKAVVAPDSRVSAMWGAAATGSTIRQDAIFSSDGAMNNRWVTMSPSTSALKFATLKWPDSNRAGLARIGTDNRVSYRYFNDSL